MSTIAPWFSLPAPPVLGNIAVIGAGLAGCHIAYELAQRGHPVTLVDAANEVAGAASGNNAGIVKPFVTRSPSTIDAFYQAGFNHLTALLRSNPSLSFAANFKQCGVLQLLERAYPDNDVYQFCTAKQASDIAGTRIDSEAIFFPDAGWLNPAALCRALANHERITTRLRFSVERLCRAHEQWQIVALDGEQLDCHTLILANGHRLNQFEQTAFLPIVAARGQTSRCQVPAGCQLNTVVSGKRYAIPEGSTISVGASYSPGNENSHESEADHLSNLQGIDTVLPAIAPTLKPYSGFCAVRATTPDRLPLLGPVPDNNAYESDYALLKNGLPWKRFSAARYQTNLYVIGGFGSRGIVTAALAAQLLATHLCTGSHSHSESGTLDTWHSQCHPARFLVRTIKRAGSDVAR